MSQFGNQPPYGDPRRPVAGPQQPRYVAPAPPQQPRYVAPPASPPQGPPPSTQTKPIWKRPWFIILGIVVLLGLGSMLTGGDDDANMAAAPAAETSTVAETSEPEPAATEAEPEPEPEPAPEPEPEPEVPSEYRAALRSAQNYLDFMHFSYAGLYDQLTSEYGENFPAEAAQYAMDNVKADWNAEALEAAISYREIMAMSDAQIWDQLTSEYGEKFTPEQADYAIANMPA
jgi:hypothetical protein